MSPWELPAVRRILGERGIARARHWLGEARWAVGLVGLPLAVVRFQLRARRLAWRSEDYLSLMSATRPAKLRTLLALARGSQYVAELGTATGWTAISLALADGGRRVITFDVIGRPEPRRYLAGAPGALTRKSVPAAELPFEFMLNALRLVDGFEIETFAQRTGLEWDEIAPTVKNLVARQLLTVQGTRLATTLVGLRFLNDLLLSFLAETPQTTGVLDCQRGFEVY